MTDTNDSIQFNWKDSAYRFTKPVRYYKSNDPYYWEVDNIPIKQLEENVLWLRDQFSSFEISGIQREQFMELKPQAAPNRQVSVLPGKFIGRVNDAYNKGITTMEKMVYESMDPNQQRKIRFNVSTDLLNRIAGDIIGDPIYNNGLYEHLQHHDVSPYGSPSLAWRNVGPEQITDIPKNKLARWRQSTTSDTSIERLSQQSVEFTRRWGGVARTALVNVKDTLTIDVPPFDANDYNNKLSYTPTIRFDLLFLYTHPIDAKTTTIAKPSGAGPTTITAPRLGIVKGAGVLSLKGEGPFLNYSSKTSDAGFFSESTFNSNIGNNQAFFSGDESINSQTGNYQIASPISDLTQTDSGINNKFGNFPSPDDLMNLAPLIQEDIENSFSLIGQSVLPLAYIVVRKNATEIVPSDIIDIRPFFRTTELAYNERSGIAAAFPPLSLANPAVGKTELNTAVLKAVAHVKEYVDESIAANAGGGGGADVDTGAGDDTGPAPPTIRGSVITNGTICGGTLWGPEGAVLNLAARYDLYGVTSGTGGIVDETKAVEVLNKAGLNGLTELPRYPGWDLGTWTTQGVNTGVGTYTLDYCNDAVLYGKDRNQPGWAGALEDGPEKSYLAGITGVQSKVFQTTQGVGGSSPNQYYYDSEKIIRFVRKRLEVELPSTDYVDFDVTCNFLNCFVNQRATSTMTSSDNQGYYIEKLGISGNKAKFNIVVPIPRDPSRTQAILAPECDIAARQSNRPGVAVLLSNITTLNAEDTYQDRDRMTYPNAPSDDVQDRTYYKLNKKSKALPGPTYVFYPTVSFVVYGYKSIRPGNIIYDTDSATSTSLLT